jgi:Mn2+/Fe2+ NRAMP family transporter
VLDTGAMGNTSRDLRETVVRAMAKVGLVWAVAVLGALFMTTAAQGRHHDGGYTLSSASAQAHHAVTSGGAPHPAGLALALLVLVGGAAVLVVGAMRGDRAVEPSYDEEPDPAVDLTLALDLVA